MEHCTGWTQFEKIPQIRHNLWKFPVSLECNSEKNITALEMFNMFKKKDRTGQNN